MALREETDQRRVQDATWGNIHPNHARHPSRQAAPSTRYNQQTEQTVHIDAPSENIIAEQQRQQDERQRLEEQRRDEGDSEGNDARSRDIDRGSSSSIAAGKTGSGGGSATAQYADGWYPDPWTVESGKAERWSHPNRVSKPPPGRAGLKRSSSTPESPSLVDGRHKRVWKACERCRMKKTKCDGESPCKRCKDDGLICTAGNRKKTEYKQTPRGYAEVLENTVFALDSTVAKLYNMIRNNEPWTLEEPSINDRGLPAVHDIADALGCIRPSAEYPFTLPDPDRGFDDMFARLKAAEASGRSETSERKYSDHSSTPSLARTERESSSGTEPDEGGAELMTAFKEEAPVNERPPGFPQNISPLNIRAISESMKSNESSDFSPDGDAFPDSPYSTVSPFNGNSPMQPNCFTLFRDGSNPTELMNEGQYLSNMTQQPPNFHQNSFYADVYTASTLNGLQTSQNIPSNGTVNMSMLQKSNYWGN
ncbi:hypothetical protein B7494_g5280 [Chlorociboria aeruginascens]|nr:hypothetical protein B7494_g5280 [Chlorociboria aeruginascens]